VTAEIIAPPVKACDLPHLERLVTSICYLLSIASGTKVQWISRKDHLKTRRTASISHFSRVTKPYTPLRPLDLEAIGVLRAYLEQTLPVYYKRRENFNLEKSVVDWYLDSKVETDYLEVRGAKVAISMETLKNSFLQSNGEPNDAFVIPKTQMQRLLPDLQSALRCVLEKYGVQGDDANEILKDHRILEMNRQTFRHSLKKMATFLELNLHKEMSRCINIRNALVHSGDFETPSQMTKLEQYLFMVNILDRMLLRLVGYRGPYIDWSKPNHPIPSQI
jgi:hypothetical protein